MTSEPEKLLPEAREFFALECEKHGFDTQAAAIRAGNISYVDGGQVCIDAMIAFARHRLSSPVSGTDMVMVPKKPTAQMEQAGAGYIWEDGLNHEARCDAASNIYRAMLSASRRFSPPVPADNHAATVEQCIQDRADWLLDAIAGATQDRRYLRGDQAYDEAAGGAILANGAKAIRIAIERVTAAPSASPAAPIPVIAEAGEREPLLAREIAAQFYDKRDPLDQSYRDVAHNIRRGKLDDQDAVELVRFTLAHQALSTPATLDNTAVENACERSWNATHRTLWAHTDADTRAAWTVGIRAVLTAKTEKAE